MTPFKGFCNRSYSQNNQKQIHYYTRVFLQGMQNVHPIILAVPKWHNPYTSCSDLYGRILINELYFNLFMPRKIQPSGHLTQRRRDMRLVLMYKIANGLVAVPASPHLRPITRSSRLCHPAGYLVPSSTSDYHKFSFFPRTIREWNALPLDIPISQTPEAFKASLKSLSTT